MAAMLRSSRFLACVAKSINRSYLNIPDCRPVLSSVVSTTENLVAPNITKRSAASQGIPQVASEEGNFVLENARSLEKAFYRIDLDVRRIGRIGKKDVTDIFEMIIKNGTANSTQSLLLIRCCGSLLADELPSSRTELITTIWNKLQEFSCPMDVSHYNALLKVYLENEYKFSPTDILSTMETKGIQPNRVTYQRLITRYCQDGDIDGASKILEFMKTKEIAVNEMVFNSLIMGHARANDMENAKNILEVMRNAKLDPSPDTYTSLLCGYAEKGDIESINHIFQEAEKNDIMFQDKDYLNIITTLAVNDHDQYIDEIVSKLHKSSGYIQDCINSILELVNRGKENVGYKLLKTMSRTLNPDSTPAPAGHFFIRQLVRTEKSIQKIIKFCEDMKANDLNTMGILKAAEVALLTHKIDYSIAFLKEMHKEGFPIRCHYFWPVIIDQRKNRNEEAIFSTLKLMAEMGSLANYETYTDYALPGLNTEDPDNIIEKTKDIGHSVGSVVNPLVHYFLTQNKMIQALDLVKKYPVRLSPVLLIRALTAAYKDTGDKGSVLQLLEHIVENRERGADHLSKSDWVGQFLLEYLFLTNNDISALEDILLELSNRDLFISHQTVDSIKLKLKGNFPVSLNMLLEQIATAALDAPPEDEESSVIPHPRNFNIEELENHLIEIKSKGLNARGILRRLLMLHCRYKNYSRAMEIKEELEKDAFPFSAAMYAQLIELHVSQGNLEEALTLKQRLGEYDPNFALDDHKLLNLAALMVSSDRSDDAFSLIKNHHEKFGVKEKPDFLQRNVWRVLTAAADKGDVQLVHKLFDTLVSNIGYTTVSNTILGPLIKAYLINDNLNGAVTEFENCAKKYRQAPWKNELFKKLIAVEDSEKLQKVMDLNAEIHGEMNTMYDLGCSFIECGQIRQAKKIFETPGIRARHHRLDAICERYIAQNMVTELEHLVKMTRDLFDIDRDKMYYFLLRAYAKTGDVEKALGVWTSMQEESVQPSSQTLCFLAEFLQKNNHSIPFVIPQLQEEAVNNENSLIESIKAENVDEALELKRRIEEQGGKLSPIRTSDVMEILIRKDRLKDATKMAHEILSHNSVPNPRVMKFLLVKLVRNGDVDSINALGSHLSPETMRSLSFHNLLSNAYVNSGRHLEYLKNLESNVLSSRYYFPAGGILGILDKFPELEERVSNLAEKYAIEADFNVPKNMVWMHYFLHENYEKANEVYQSCPALQERLMFTKIMQEARDTNNETMAQKLVEVMKATKLSPKSKGLAYSCLIDILVQKKKLEECLDVIKEASGSILLSDFSRSSLCKLRDELLMNNKKVPFEIPQTNSIIEDSSSSDSDNEEKL